MTSAVAGTVVCDNCGQTHVAEYHHEGFHGEGAIFVVVCTEDWLEDFYTRERVAGLSDAL